MTTNDLYLLWIYALNKNEAQGYASPADFNLLINSASRNYAAYLLGSFQQYTPGRLVARVELGQNSVVRQRLAPIIYGYNLNVDVNGFSPFPGDYLQTDAVWSIYGFRRIRYADQHKFSAIYGSVIDPVATNPIYVLEDSGFVFYPQNTANAKLHYVRNPPSIHWGYDEDANGIPVYSEAKSLQPVWDDVALFEILIRALQLAGVNLQLGVVMQYVESIKQTGQ